MPLATEEKVASATSGLGRIGHLEGRKHFVTLFRSLLSFVLARREAWSASKDSFLDKGFLMRTPLPNDGDPSVRGHLDDRRPTLTGQADHGRSPVGAGEVGRLGPELTPLDGARLAEEAASFLAANLADVPRGHGGGSPKRILLPYTNSDPAERALEAAIELADVLPIEVRVLHLREWEPGRGGSWFHESREEAVALTRSALNRLHRHGVAATGFVRVSARARVPHEIAAKAFELRAWAIVLGARPRNRLSSLLRGSVSLAVTRSAPCPILLVRHDESRTSGDGSRGLKLGSSRSRARRPAA